MPRLLDLPASLCNSFLTRPPVRPSRCRLDDPLAFSLAQSFDGSAKDSLSVDWHLRRIRGRAGANDVFLTTAVKCRICPIRETGSFCSATELRPPNRSASRRIAENVRPQTAHRPFIAEKPHCEPTVGQPETLPKIFPMPGSASKSAN